MQEAPVCVDLPDTLRLCVASSGLASVPSLGAHSNSAMLTRSGGMPALEQPLFHVGLLGGPPPPPGPGPGTGPTPEQRLREDIHPAPPPVLLPPPPAQQRP